jgi:SAM-dependent methyltransferase
VVALFDVLEHVDDDDIIIQNLFKMLKTGGKAIVTVPAHMWLWSKNDRVCSHRRRYEVKQLRYLFEKNGFKILKAHCFFVSILPLLYLRHIFSKDTGSLKDADYKKRFKINPVLNFLLEKILKFENRILPLKFFKVGGSVILVAKKTL